jgi:hypothetical protein
MKLIEFTQPVVFRDCEGNMLKQYNVGDTEEYTTIVGTADCGYFVTSWGGIFTYEAKVKQ